MAAARAVHHHQQRVKAAVDLVGIFRAAQTIAGVAAVFDAADFTVCDRLRQCRDALRRRAVGLAARVTLSLERRVDARKRGIEVLHFDRVRLDPLRKFVICCRLHALSPKI